MKLYTKIHLVLAFILIIFECIICQVAYNSIEKCDIENIVGTGAIGFVIYLLIVLILILGKHIIELYNCHKLKETILTCFVTIGGLVILALIYQIGYQIAIVFGVDHKTAEVWPLCVFLGLFLLYCLYMPIEKFVFWINDIKK